jgi:UTP--glucose-1-phosphate uridylyltransferase
MPVKKGVIPCAGWSTRFLPAVKSYAKQLVPVLHKPNLQYIVEEFLGAGIAEICIVHRPGEETIKRFFDNDPDLDHHLEENQKADLLQSWREMRSAIKRLEFLAQPFPPAYPYGNGIPLLVAEKFINNEPFVYTWGDDLLIEDQPGNLLKQMIAVFGARQAAMVIGTQKITLEEVSRYGMFKIQDETTHPLVVQGIIEKPTPDQVPSLWAHISPFVISPAIFPYLKTQTPGKGKEVWLADVGNRLAQEQLVLAYSTEMAKAKWLTTGDPLNWLMANLEFAWRDPQIGPAIKDYLRGLKPLNL